MGGQGTSSCCEKMVEQMKLCWREGSYMTGEGSFWGSITMAHSAGRPVFTVMFLGPCHSPLLATGVAEMSPTQEAVSALEGSPSDPREFTPHPRG